MIEKLKPLFAFFIDGLLIGVLFDLFRATRRICKTSNLITYIEDVLFWVIAGALTLYIIDVFTDGQIRLYLILMLISGYIFYMTIFSKYVLKICTKPFEKIKKLIIFQKKLKK